MGICNSTVLARIEASGGQPTGTTASDTQLRISEAASPNRKICTSWPASAKALACRNGNAALVGSSEPQALLIRTVLMFPPLESLAGGTQRQWLPLPISAPRLAPA